MDGPVGSAQLSAELSVTELALVPFKMLFWHNQLVHLWPSPGEPYPGPTSSLLR